MNIFIRQTRQWVQQEKRKRVFSYSLKFTD